MIEDYADLLKLIKEKVQPSPLEQSSIRVLPNTLVTRLCLALSEAETLSESWDKQHKRIADLEAAGKSLISELGEGSAADWPELHLEADKLRKLLTQQPAKEEESSMFTDNHFPELKEQLDKLSVLGD
jgi:uncharacterized protein YhaN